MTTTANRITLSGGELAANSTCTISVDVTSSTIGTFTNTIRNQDVTTDQLFPTTRRSADLTVNPANAEILLVKRITAINNTDVTGFVNDGVADSADDNPNWPTPLSDFLRGSIGGEVVQPRDRIEYTIYFLSSGSIPVENLQIELQSILDLHCPCFFDLKIITTYFQLVVILRQILLDI